MNNLAGDIETLRGQLGGPADQDRRATLVERLLLRAQVVGRLADLDRALALAEEGVARHPREGAAYLSRARVRERLHLFAPALADLDAAAAAGSREPALATVRATVLAATGREEEAARIWSEARAVRPTIALAGAEAAAAAARGD